MGDQHGVADKAVKLRQELGDRRLVFEQFRGDAVDFYGALRDPSPRVDKLVDDLLAA